MKHGARDLSWSQLWPLLFVVASTVLLMSACELPITEPEDQPPTIWNSLDQPVDIYVVVEDEAATRSFVVTLSPGETYVWENPQGRWGCVEGDLVAVLDGRDIDRVTTYIPRLCENDNWGVRDGSELPED